MHLAERPISLISLILQSGEKCEKLRSDDVR